MAELLRIENMGKRFGGLNALSDISFTVNDDEIFGVIGPNGAGKTTFFNCVTGFDPPTQGRVFFCGEETTRFNVTKYCSKGMSRTFQNLRVFGQMDVLNNVLAGMHKHMKARLLDIVLDDKRIREEKRTSMEKAHEIIEFMGLTEAKGELAGSLPYGTQRRLEIARALAGDPKVILLDEPTAGMNPQETDELMHLIKRIHKLGPAVIVIEHNIRFMMNLVDRLAVFNFGRLLDCNVPEVIQNNPEVIEAYLGSAGE